MEEGVDKVAVADWIIELKEWMGIKRAATFRRMTLGRTTLNQTAKHK